MKVVILAGGLGSRLSEETDIKPKPMVEIGGHPILWHIMKMYSQHGCNDFIICLGYKGYVIKEYFHNYYMHLSDVTIDIRTNEVTVHRTKSEPWRITLVDTGEATMTGGRLKRVAEHIGNEDFCFTYGDGVSDIDITALLAFHKKAGTLATVTAVYPPGRFGALDIENNKVARFEEKPTGDGARINGGFFVLSPKVIDYVTADDTVWEQDPMRRLAAEGQLSSYTHDGFWQPMDTLRERHMLESMWANGQAKWKTWA
jgi:glucose-1-phosphate cytidylyltransferase